MRDRRFVAIQRGGTLTLEEHRTLMAWARVCLEHSLPLCGDEIYTTVWEALNTVGNWQEGTASTGEAIEAARRIHSLARTINNPPQKAFLRAAGHTVATAHMSDHSLGAALYVQKALKLAGMDYSKEREWQEERLKELPGNLVNLVKEHLIIKAKGLGL